MFLKRKNKKKAVEVEPKKQRKKESWFYADSHFEDVEEEKRIKSDPDYRAFRNLNPF